MQPPEMRRLNQREDENAKLKKIVAGLSLDREMLQDVLTGHGPEAHDALQRYLALPRGGPSMITAWKACKGSVRPNVGSASSCGSFKP